MSISTRWPTIEGEFEFEDEFELEDEDEFELEDEFEDELEDELELEFEDEGEFESEYFVNPIRRVYPDAEGLMAHLGKAAAEAEYEDEAEAFLPLLMPLASSRIPRHAPAVMKAAPHVTRPLNTLVRKLRKTPQGRRLVRTVPTIVDKTARSLAAQSRRGRRITPSRARRTLARQADAVLCDPVARRAALRRSKRSDSRYHRHDCRCR
ncbi:MAG: hypothetical protein ACLPQS_09705 [Acidimicrobiales bacterium]